MKLIVQLYFYPNYTEDMSLELKSFSYTGSDSDFRKLVVCSIAKRQCFTGNTRNCYLEPSDLWNLRWLYVCLKKDSGDPIELSNCIFINIPSSSGGPSTTVSQNSERQTITDEDDELGQANVEYCDQTSGEGYEL